MWNPAILTLALCLLIFQYPVKCQDAESELGLGKAINIFMRYGYLSICMRVVPRNDTENWVFREPTVNVFKGIDFLAKPPRREVQTKPKPLFDGDFHLEFCDNLKQLLQAYFRDFSFERLDKPWRAFTAGWPTDIMARNLGINSSFIFGDHCYVLVRVARYRESAKLRDLPRNVEVEGVVADAIARSNGDAGSIAEFIKKYGTHYIASYVTGNALYQVFVYSRNVYNRIKERLKTKGVSDLSNFELGNYFSPWYAEHIGQIKVASGNKTVENWTARKLRIHYYIFTYPSLLKLHSDPSLLKTLNNLLGNEAMLQLELKTLSPAFKEDAKKLWFEEMIDNYLKLWENNM